MPPRPFIAAIPEKPPPPPWMTVPLHVVRIGGRLLRCGDAIICSSRRADSAACERCAIVSFAGFDGVRELNVCAPAARRAGEPGRWWPWPLA